MEKYKALKEYIEICNKRNLQISIINNLPVKIYTRYSQINNELNSLLKEWYKKQPKFVNISKNPNLNDKA